MRTNLKTFLNTVAVAAGLVGGSAVYAHATDTPKQEGSGGMMQGGQGGMMNMMNMMQQMSQMMETCSKKMAQHHGPEAPKEGAVPEKKG